MPSDTLTAVLQDIRRNIEFAHSFIDGMTFEQFAPDRKTVYAVIRCLEIISGASRKLPDNVKARHPAIPWRNVAGAGNVYRHDYENVMDAMVWRTVSESLGPLLATVTAELAFGS